LSTKVIKELYFIAEQGYPFSSSIATSILKHVAVAFHVFAQEQMVAT
jgi:hypothetical protein